MIHANLYCYMTKALKMGIEYVCYCHVFNGSNEGNVNRYIEDIAMVETRLTGLFCPENQKSG